MFLSVPPAPGVPQPPCLRTFVPQTQLLAQGKEQNDLIACRLTSTPQVFLNLHVCTYLGAAHLSLLPKHNLTPPPHPTPRSSSTSMPTRTCAWTARPSRRTGRCGRPLFCLFVFTVRLTVQERMTQTPHRPLLLAPPGAPLALPFLGRALSGSGPFWGFRTVRPPCASVALLGLPTAASYRRLLPQHEGGWAQ